MSYHPNTETAMLLDRAYQHIASTPYQVTARWVFYQLLQEAWLHTKADYKKLLSYLSKARKQFYGPWRPDTLADDTRQAEVRGDGYATGNDWFDAVKRMTCNLDRWKGQDQYIEVWFEASAMQSQFLHYTNGNIPLLAFHGDVSIPEKWKAAVRLYDRWRRLECPITVLYYGDLDQKGLEIPQSAHRDVQMFLMRLMAQQQRRDGHQATGETVLAEYERMQFTFERVGLKEDHPVDYNIPENPERPGTYQWEALSDDGAQELIEVANSRLDLDCIDRTMTKEDWITDQFSDHLTDLELEEERPDEE